jgi:hypothetical protein
MRYFRGLLSLNFGGYVSRPAQKGHYPYLVAILAGSAATILLKSHLTCFYGWRLEYRFVVSHPSVKLTRRSLDGLTYDGQRLMAGDWVLGLR